ncbi:MAG: segregation/condensation protein A [Stygiobacter sp.]|jgi:segregation and condensation protein A|uniref:Segregation and condensation protein A n=1 Tax=Stygiobacter electus TaxID=3032292 RepID=A0AAE3TBM0_9BACT|nr:segregation/condensation protein A [Stygiobacter electus]MDF1611443.1 segregation/condensation protein A [Stygiobacter electus]
MYRIKLQHFEGPLDLLLFFIKRDELDIYDIPISKITKEFIEYLHFLEQLDLDVAGEFILMAATLMQIKVKMLLPREVDEKGEEIDPRADLVKALLEYKRYKEMSEELSFLEANQRNYMYRGNFDSDYKESPPDYEVLLKNISLYDLIKAFKKVLMNRKEEPVHQIRKWNITIDDQIEYIKNKLAEKFEMNFYEMMKDLNDKIKIVVTFIAMLEMIKAGTIGLRETGVLNDFTIYLIQNG